MKSDKCYCSSTCSWTRPHSAMTSLLAVATFMVIVATVALQSFNLAAKELVPPPTWWTWRSEILVNQKIQIGLIRIELGSVARGFDIKVTILFVKEIEGFVGVVVPNNGIVWKGKGL
ncbi:hypothetical protein VNO78_07348 [Psophocarpus tetragonolobus]|uniref:Uncharacterized protein n=1 Tax=Psophocarpus tetragonolobus TaxID=3891 RepID=A0AAN9SSX4_PSOTE